jgi:hypothetical protein
MTSSTATTHPATTAFSSRRAFAALAAGALLLMALLVALLLVVQSGHGTPATSLPAQERVQQDRGIDQQTEPIYFRGRPY